MIWLMNLGTEEISSGHIFFYSIKSHSIYTNKIWENMKTSQYTGIEIRLKIVLIGR